jgi:hypothetical protein
MSETAHPIIDEFAGADLGDPRRNDRLIALAKRMGRQPEASFPKALSSAELEAAYRFFNNVKVQPSEILEPHVRQTLQRMADAVTLVVHDSSTVSFTSEGYRDGLVSLQGGKQEFVVHCSLAVRADGSRTPLGVLVASHHLPVKTDEKRLQERWSQHVRAVHALGLPSASVVHLMDREADDYEVLELMRCMNGRFVVRVQHNRRLVEDGHLRDTLEESVCVAEREVRLSRRSGKGRGPKQRKVHPPREGRVAKLSFAACEVSIPRTTCARQAITDAISLNVVRVWEPAPPEGEAPVEWLLYTSEPIDTAEQILRVVDWYRARWTIEEYFKALKTGCAMEKRQLGDLHALANALALFLPIAWRLLFLKSEARERPDAPATEVLDEDELAVLRAAGRTRLSAEPTVQEAMLAVAALGGHLKHNGPPGWQTLAFGYMRLRALTEGWLLRRAVEAGIVAPPRDQ